MAELLGVAASGISIVSFAIQIAESIQKLKNFHSLVQSAPANILLLIDEIETLSLILEDIDRSVQNSVFLDPHTKGMVMRSYTLCQKSGHSLKTLVQELEEGLKVGKKRGALKIALKNEKIEDLRKRLESAKMTMSLANQLYDRAVQQQRFDSQERGIDHLVAQVGSMLSMRTSIEKVKLGIATTGSSMTTVEEVGERCVERTTGCLTQRSKLYGSRIRDQSYKTMISGMVNITRTDRENSTEITISLRLPSWLYARRYDILFRQFYQGWDHSFRSYRVIPYESVVFDYSMKGDVEGLQKLFSTRQASPFEIDLEGRTPLHLAALYRRPQACHFLLEMGADANLPTFSSLDPYSKYTYLGDMDYRGHLRHATPLHSLAWVGDNKYPCFAYEDQLTRPRGFRDTVEMLITHGNADLFFRDHKDDTVYDIYAGPAEVLHWMKQQNQEYFSNLSLRGACELISNCFMEANLEVLIPDGFIPKLPGKVEPLAIHDALVDVIHSWIRAHNYIYARWEDKNQFDVLLRDLLVVELRDCWFHHHKTPDWLNPTIWYKYFSNSLYRYLSQRDLRRMTKRLLCQFLDAGLKMYEIQRAINHHRDQEGGSFQLDCCWFPPAETHILTQSFDLKLGESLEEFQLSHEELYVDNELLVPFWAISEGNDGQFDWDWHFDSWSLRLEWEKELKDDRKPIPGAWPELA